MEGPAIGRMRLAAGRSTARSPGWSVSPRWRSSRAGFLTTSRGPGSAISMPSEPWPNLGRWRGAISRYQGVQLSRPDLPPLDPGQDRWLGSHRSLLRGRRRVPAGPVGDAVDVERALLPRSALPGLAAYFCFLGRDLNLDYSQVAQRDWQATCLVVMALLALQSVDAAATPRPRCWRRPLSPFALTSFYFCRRSSRRSARTHRTRDGQTLHREPARSFATWSVVFLLGSRRRVYTADPRGRPS